MAGIGVDKLFAQAFEQAGYGLSGLSAGAREQLMNYVEDMASKYGFGEAFTNVKTLISNKDVTISDEPESDSENLPALQSCMKESGAAAISSIISGAANAMEYFVQVRNGQMQPKDACLKIISETVASAADSAIKAAGAKGKEMILERYGSEENAIKAFASQGITSLLEKTSLSGNGQSIGNFIVNMLGGKSGSNLQNVGEMEIDITPQEKNGTVQNQMINIASQGAMNLVKNRFSSLPGQVSTLFTRLKAVPKGVPPNPYTITAAIVITIASKIAHKNCIEKPFQDLLRNTDSLKAATEELERVSLSICKGQKLFAQYLESDTKMAQELKKQLTRVDQAGQAARDAIFNI